MVDITTIQDMSLRDALLVLVACIAAALIGAIVLLVLAARQIANLDVPEDADFFETLQRVPITVPLALDLLDMAFDIFSAPISWIVLELLGLRALQLVTIFEGLIPGTQIIPTMTIAWVVARLMRRKQPTPLRTALREYQLEQDALRYGGLRRSRPLLAEQYRRRALPAPYDEEAVEGEYFEEDLDEPPPDFFDEDEAGWR